MTAYHNSLASIISALLNTLSKIPTIEKSGIARQNP